MAVAADGTRFGSVGGGLLEYKVSDKALQRLRLDDGEAFSWRLVHDPAAGDDASGLICAGEQTQAFVPLHGHDLDVIRKLMQELERGQGVIMEASPGGLVFQWGASSQSIARQSQPSEHWHYRESMRPAETLYIFGGGHISLPLSQLGRMLGFRVHVLDDREHLDTMQANEFAHYKKHIDYRDAASAIIHPPTAHVVIMTVSHASDQQILALMLPLELAYLGMIGSKNKVKTIFKNLEAMGAGQRQLERVHSPVGLDIHAETPEEIAVSIAAQLVSRKNSSRS